MELLPLVEITRKTHFEQIDFSNIALIACQPLLGCTQAMLYSLVSMGLDPNHIFCIGKAYSSNIDIIKSLRKSDIYVHDTSLSYDSHESFDHQFRQHLSNFFLYIENNRSLDQYKKIILLDDGGELIKCAYERNINKKCVAVEQTSSGFNLLKNKHNPFIPIVNVARSHAKLQIEAPLISESIVNKLSSFLEQNNLDKHLNVLILGKGIIGKNIESKLDAKYVKRSVDLRDMVGSVEAEKQLKSYLFNSQIIIGCTGSKSLPHKLHQFIQPETVLVSASSSDREFDAVFLRRFATSSTKPHTNLYVRNLYLTNSGFPINFHGGRYGSIPLKYIQLTLALLFAGICQAVDQEFKCGGFYDLSKKIHDQIIENFFDINVELREEYGCLTEVD